MKPSSDAGELFVGAMTGTSMDGLDLALIRIDDDGRIVILHGDTVELPEALRAELAALSQPPEHAADDANDTEIERMGRADRALGAFSGKAIEHFLSRHQIDARSVRAIGSHGQTIRHRPSGTDPYTLQIGDPNQIAERTGICTVADFRRRDMAAGGQGAPLVPLFHEALFGAARDEAIAAGQDGIGILNIGGIANLSVLTASGVKAGFDTGPGNGLMDAWISASLSKPYDGDGAWARSGQSDGAALEQLLSDPYFAAAAPKSTGREYFSLLWLAQRLGPARLASLDPVQVQATLLELTAQSAARAAEAAGFKLSQLLVCGGGRANGYLMDRLAAATSMAVRPTEAIGIDGDSLEAAAFAWFAHRAIAGLAGNVPEATGASGPRVLGAVYPA